jgi:hypothetical protein
MSWNKSSLIVAMLVAIVIGPATALALTRATSTPAHRVSHHARKHSSARKHRLVRKHHVAQAARSRKKPPAKTPTRTTTTSTSTGTTTTAAATTTSTSARATSTAAATTTTTFPATTTATTTTATSSAPATTTTATTTRTTPTNTTATTTSSTTTTTTATTPPVSVPLHVATWAYDDACGGGQGTGASAALVHQWVSYAESNCSNDSTKVLSDCHANGITYCTAIQYVDANWIYAQGSLPVAKDAQENWWLHQPGYTDAAHRLSSSAYGGGNILNQSNPAVESWFQNYVRTNYNAYDALMMDDTSASLSNLTWGSGYSTSQELGSDPQLQAAHAQMAAAMTHTNGQPFLQIDNGLSPNNNLAPPFPMLNDSTGVKGVLTEGSPIANGTLVSYYSTLLDEMAHVNQTPNDFVVLLSYDPSGSPQARRVQTATVLLGYSPGHTVSWSDLETNSSNLAIWPEEGIVPTNPIQTMSTPTGTDCLTGHGAICTTGGHNNLQAAPNIYRREFAACYNQQLRGQTVLSFTGLPRQPGGGVLHPARTGSASWRTCTTW